MEDKELNKILLTPEQLSVLPSNEWNDEYGRWYYNPYEITRAQLKNVEDAGYTSPEAHNAELEVQKAYYEREIERLVGLERAVCQNQKQEMWEDIQSAIAIERNTGISVRIETIKHKWGIECTKYMLLRKGHTVIIT